MLLLARWDIILETALLLSSRADKVKEIANNVAIGNARTLVETKVFRCSLD
jgi:hypothetical protein